LGPVAKRCEQLIQVCGLKITPDHAAALEILTRGLRLVSATPAMVGVLREASGFRQEA